MALPAVALLVPFATLGAKLMVSRANRYIEERLEKPSPMVSAGGYFRKATESDDLDHKIMYLSYCLQKDPGFTEARGLIDVVQASIRMKLDELEGELRALKAEHGGNLLKALAAGMIVGLLMFAMLEVVGLAIGIPLGAWLANRIWWHGANAELLQRMEIKKTGQELLRNRLDFLDGL